MKSNKLVKISFLSIILTVFSFIKLPGIVPGTEFQLSAPIAVSICSIFGFKIYILCGIISSIITFFLGTHNLINILNSFIFRIVVGLILHFSNKNIFFISISGPIGSLVSRIFLSIMTKANFLSLLLSALPGMVYTFFTAYPITKFFQKLLRKEGKLN